MRTLMVMVVVLASACGQGVPYAPDPVDPTQTMTARIENDYAESLFSMTVNVTSGGATRSIQLFEDVRIAGYRSASRDFSAKPGDVVTFDFASMSLGERRTFPTSTKLGPVEAGKDVLEVTYDYDLATANFVISYRWSSY